MVFDKVLEKFKLILRNRNYSEQTISNYSCYLLKFLFDLNVDPHNLTLKQLNDYLLNFNYTSTSQQNQIINSLKLFYELILNKKYIHLNKIKRPKKEKSLPKVISYSEIKQVLDSINNFKHKTIISLAFSTGLRISEVCNLKICNIDKNRMLIKVISGKGKKDRIVPLSENMLNILESYFSQYTPLIYVFESYLPGKKYSTSSCRKIWNKYKIDVESTFHTLRHSCFTFLLENGTDIRIIQKIAGHTNIKTTEIYTHVSNELLNKVKLPI